MKDAGSGMGVKNISELVWKEIHDIQKTKKPPKEQFNKYNILEREIYGKFGNLSKKELRTKSKENCYVRNDVLTTIIKRCRSEKKKGITAIDRFVKNKLLQILKFLSVQSLK